MEHSLANVYQSNQMVDSIAVIHPVDSNGVATTSAAIKAAIESINGGWVVFLAGTYTIDAVIAPNSYTKIIADGDVQLDWDGVAEGIMFTNGAADHVYYEGLHWIKNHAIYRPVVMYDNDVLNNCQQDDTGCAIFAIDSIGIYNCRDLYYVSLFMGPDSVISNSGIAYVLDLYNITGLKVSKSWINGIYLADADAYATDLDITFDHCDIIQTAPTGLGACFLIATVASAPSIIRNIKFNRCFWEPLDNTLDCIQVEGNVNLLVHKLEVSSCEFRDYNDCYSVAANTIISGWKLKDNEYVDEAGLRYNFVETPLALDLSKDGDYL